MCGAAFSAILTVATLALAFATAPPIGRWSSVSAVLVHGFGGPAATLAQNLLLYGAGTVTLGCLGVTLTLFVRDEIAWAILGTLGLGAYAIWMAGPGWGLVLPPFQSLLLAHAPVNHGAPAWLGISGSLELDTVLVLLCAVAGLWRSGRMAI